MEINIKRKKIYYLTLSQEEMQALMRIFGNISQDELNFHEISEEVAKNLTEMYNIWYYS